MEKYDSCMRFFNNECWIIEWTRLSRQLFVAKDAAPTAELKVRRYYHAYAFIEVRDNLKQQLCFLAIQRYISPFAADQGLQLEKHLRNP